MVTSGICTWGADVHWGLLVSVLFFEILVRPISTTAVVNCSIAEPIAEEEEASVLRALQSHNHSGMLALFVMSCGFKLYQGVDLRARTSCLNYRSKNLTWLV